MDKLIKRFNADRIVDTAAILIYAEYLSLPYVEQDLIELMEIWGNEETEVITVTLVLESKEEYSLPIQVGSLYSYPDFVTLLGL